VNPGSERSWNNHPSEFRFEATAFNFRIVGNSDIYPKLTARKPAAPVLCALVGTVRRARSLPLVGNVEEGESYTPPLLWESRSFNAEETQADRKSVPPDYLSLGSESLSGCCGKIEIVL